MRKRKVKRKEIYRKELGQRYDKPLCVITWNLDDLLAAMEALSLPSSQARIGRFIRSGALDQFAAKMAERGEEELERLLRSLFAEEIHDPFIPSIPHCDRCRNPIQGCACPHD